MRIMRACCLATVLIFFLLALIAPVPGLSQSAPTAGPAPQSSIDPDRDVSIKQLPANILADQKSIWLFPVSIAHGEHILPTVGVVGATAVFFATDAHSAPPFRTTTAFNGFNNAFSGTNSAAMIIAIPAVIYGVGLVRKDSYAQSSALLAGEAFVDGLLLELPMKAITARRQPLSYSGDGPYSGSFFNGSHNPFKDGGFYSGHTVAAMAVATVLAHRYRHHRWVPLVAYGLAGAISFSRLTTSNHFAGDVFFGGAMGFVIARYAVLPAR